MEQSKLNQLKKELIDLCGHISEVDIEKIKVAIDFSERYHQNQKRKSGDPYLIHPLRTAILLAKIKLDKDTIIAAILHDTLEDTPATQKDIKNNFGVEVLKLVEGVTKLGKVRIKKSWFPFFRKKVDIPEFERQVETLRKMLVAVSQDLRVILIKFADKIHNLETLKYLDLDKQERIAREALEIYAPIAGRLGINEWKDIMEDLSFPYVYPNDYARIQKLAIPEIKEREKYLKAISKKVAKILSENKIEYKIGFRAKRWYSLYKKLERYDNDISRIHDLVALRIIVDSIEDCYKVLGVLHSKWKPIMGRIKDYIAMPKPNGYQSIHTTVFCDNKQIAEFQIRTKEMHQKAEFGIASHWVYEKEKSSRFANKEELRWLEEFSKNQKRISDPAELFASMSLDLFQDRIFVFTPKGDAKDLPINSTPIDFAYSIHTDIGNHCQGALINGKIAPLETKLKNGDIVKIIVSKKSKPKTDWLKMARTDQARLNIKKNTRG